MTTRLSINAYIKAAALSPLINCLQIRHLRPADTSVAVHLHICIEFAEWKFVLARSRPASRYNAE